MFRTLAIFVSAALLAACQFIPGQPEYRVREGERQVAMTFPDPRTTQFQGSRELRTTLFGRPNVSICGLVNTKNAMGAYTGFKRYVLNKDRTLVDPMTGADRNSVLDTLEACNDARQVQYSAGASIRSDFDVQVACDAYSDSRDVSHLQELFEHIYRNNCGGYLTTAKQAELIPPQDWDGEPRWPEAAYNRRF